MAAETRPVLVISGNHFVRPVLRFAEGKGPFGIWLCFDPVSQQCRLEYQILVRVKRVQGRHAARHTNRDAENYCECNIPHTRSSVVAAHPPHCAPPSRSITIIMKDPGIIGGRRLGLADDDSAGGGPNLAETTNTRWVIGSSPMLRPPWAVCTV